MGITNAQCASLDDFASTVTPQSVSLQSRRKCSNCHQIIPRRASSNLADSRQEEVCRNRLPSCEREYLKHGSRPTERLREDVQQDTSLEPSVPSETYYFEFDLAPLRGITDKQSVIFSKLREGESDGALVVTRVRSKSPWITTSTGETGLVQGDIILKVDDRYSRADDMMHHLYESMFHGACVTLIVRPRPVSFDVEVQRRGRFWSRLGVQVLIAGQYELKIAQLREKGLLPGWNATHGAYFQILPGDRITHVNRVASSAKHMFSIMQEPVMGEPLRLRIEPPSRLPPRRRVMMQTSPDRKKHPEIDTSELATSRPTALHETVDRIVTSRPTPLHETMDHTVTIRDQPDTVDIASDHDEMTSEFSSPDCATQYEEDYDYDWQEDQLDELYPADEEDYAEEGEESSEGVYFRRTFAI